MRPIRILGTAMAMLVIAVQPASANWVEWASSAEATGLYTGYTRHWSGDAIRVYQNYSWNYARTINLHHMIQVHNNRFTGDSHDKNWNLDAYAGYSELPNKYWDTDDEGPGGIADWKAEEAEYTSESTSFPTQGVIYETWFYYSHSFYQAGAYSGWRFSPYSGYMNQDEQLSQQYPVGDKWDTSWCCADLGDRYYPYVASPAGAASQELGQAGTPSSRDAIIGQAARRELVAFTTEATDDPGEVRIRPALARGLENYSDSARKLGRDLVKTGPAHGVVTFSRPLSRADVERIAGTGVRFLTLEAHTATLPSGLRGGLDGRYEPSFWTLMDEISAEKGVPFLGVTSATVVVETPSILNRLDSDPGVYLVDLATEQVRRSTGMRDVVMNDVYWDLAGWAY